MTENTNWMQWGTSPTNLTLYIPYPSRGMAPFMTSRFVDSGRNANGAVVGQMIGRSNDKQSMKWTAITCTKWWEINSWLETNGMFFYCRYFCHNTGAWKVRRMYVSNIEVSPEMLDSNTQIPTNGVYQNASLNVIDMGEVE